MERVRGIWKPLSVAPVYTLLQNLLGAQASRRRIVSEYLKVSPGDRFLDVGCGPADILALLPSVEYLGVDLSPRYIARARANYGARGRFEVASVDDLDAVTEGSFDVAYGGGLLHHLDDVTCTNLFASILECLKPGGRAVFVDPAWEPRQNPIANCLISMDRGLHVRLADGYASLARGTFAVVETQIVRDLLRVPYTHCVMICTKEGVI